MATAISPLARIWNLLRLEREEITQVYFYAILAGLIQLSLPLGIQSIIGFVLGAALSTSLVILIILVVVGVLCSGLLQVAQMKIIEKIQQKIFVRFSFRFADHIPKLDLRSSDAFYLPELVNRFFDIPNLQKSLSKLLLDLPTATIQILFGVVLLSFYHPFFIFFGITLLLLLWLILYITGQRGLETSLAESRFKYGVAGWLEELARVIRSFKFSAGQSELHLQKTDIQVTGYLEARKSHFRILLVQYRTLIAFKVVITASMLIIGCLLLLNQQLNIGQFIAAEIIIITIINSVEKIIVNLDSVYDVLTSVEKINKLTDKPVEESGSYQLEPDQKVGVELQNLHFGYYDEHLILHDVNLKIAPGEKVCIMGNDGAGKSTLLKLLTGAYQHFNGAILINGVPIGNYDLASLRGTTGIFLSNQDIFAGTLWDNIAMGNDAVRKDVVMDLVERTGLRTFLSGLKGGFDTELDPTGRRLPRNVVQKILLVRALAHQPRLLLLDEPWQGLEEGTKHNIQDLLLQHLPDTTVIIATNDAPFAEQCSRQVHLATTIKANKS
jgi:ABC-type bacteriocin/lantibiotic exporter with double-glycine peptidase domain